MLPKRANYRNGRATFAFIVHAEGGDLAVCHVGQPLHRGALVISAASPRLPLFRTISDTKTALFCATSANDRFSLTAVNALVVATLR